jgi:hypothetical protein
MIDFVFIYKKKETLVKGKAEDKVIDICKKFASLNEGVIPETKVYIYEGKKLNLNFTFAKQSEPNLLNEQRAEILVFDDPDKEGAINIQYDGKDNIIRFNKEEKISNVIGQFVSKFKISMQKVFFLYGGDTITNDDLEKTFTQVTKSVDNDNKVINFLAYNRESTLSINDEKEENKNDNKNYNDNNEEMQKISSEKIFENNNEKILNVDSNNEKLLNSEDNNEKICKVDNLIIDAKDPDEKYENQRKSSIYSYDGVEFNIKKVYLFFMLQIILIGVFSWLGCYTKINLKFNASTSTMLWTFIPTLIFIFIVTLSFVAMYEDEYSCFFVFNILFVPLMTFYCFLLTDYTDIVLILFQLFIILLDVLIMLLNAIVFRYSKGYWQNFFFPLIVNAIVITLACLFFKIAETTPEKVSISIISFSCIIYLIIIYRIVINDTFTNVIMPLMAFNYGIFVPGSFIVGGILYLIFCLIECACESCCCEDCCECCD